MTIKKTHPLATSLHKFYVTSQTWLHAPVSQSQKVSWKRLPRTGPTPKSFFWKRDFDMHIEDSSPNFIDAIINKGKEGKRMLGGSQAFRVFLIHRIILRVGIL